MVCTDLNLAQVHGLHKPGLGGQQTRVQAPPSRWNDLTATSVKQRQISLWNILGIFTQGIFRKRKANAGELINYWYIRASSSAQYSVEDGSFICCYIKSY